MRLLFVVPLMTGIGGIQSSLLNLLHELGPDAHDVTLCVFGNHISDDTPIPEWVHVARGPRLLEYCLADFRPAARRYPLREVPVMAVVKVLRRVVGYRRILDAALVRFRVPGRFDVAIAYANDIYSDGGFVGGANDIVSRCVDAARKVAWIHNDPTKQGLTGDRLRRTYAGFDQVVNVSSTCKGIFDTLAPELAAKSVVVHNIVDTARVDRLAQALSPFPEDNVFRLVTVARLDNRQKRLDRVVAVCDELKAAGAPAFRWHVVGGGPDEEMLRRMAHDLRVDDVLTFEGRQANPFAYVAEADVFVLTSDYEAYGMVLAEALTLGVPVVCTNFAAAVETVADGVNGILTDLTVESLAAALIRVMANPVLLGRLRDGAASRPRGNDEAMRQFEAVLTGGSPS